MCIINLINQFIIVFLSILIVNSYKSNIITLEQCFVCLFILLSLAIINSFFWKYGGN